MHASVVPILLILSVVVGTLAYINYYRDITRGGTSKNPDRSSIEPNRWVWMTWSITTAVEALTYGAVSGDWVKTATFYASALCCIVITRRVWSKLKWKMPSLLEVFCMITCFAALVLWLKYGEEWWAHLLMIVALPVAFIPTFHEARKHPEKERSSAWMLWTVSDLLVLALIWLRLEKVEELPYAILEFICHGAVWVLITRRTRKKPN